MENTGYVCLLLALCFAAYAMAASLAGAVKGNRLLTLSAERSVYAIWFCLTVASAILIRAFLTDNYRYAYVASNSNRAMAASYKFAAWWGGQEGSLLLWSWLLSCYAGIAVWRGRSGRGPAPLILALEAPQAFFLILNTFVANPFPALILRSTSMVTRAARWRRAQSAAAVSHDGAFIHPFCTWAMSEWWCRSPSPCGRCS